jgi:mono/diheme cytochrome c family protein
MRGAPLLGLASACLLATACGCVETRTDEAHGGDLFRRYCAACHGTEGRGDGPIAPSLHPPPANLTAIAKRRGGNFDEAAVMMTIDGRRLVAEHGPRDMPVWGAVFAAQHVGEPFGVYGATLDARALSDYLRTIQE